MDEVGRDHMTDEQKEELLEYETKKKAGIDERTKHRRALETEVSKLKAQVKQTCTEFDDELRELVKLRLVAQEAIDVYEVQIILLSEALVRDEDMEVRERTLADKLDVLKQQLVVSTTTTSECQGAVEECRRLYQHAVVVDRNAERMFRRELMAVPEHGDALVRLFRRRPPLPPDNATVTLSAEDAASHDPFIKALYSTEPTFELAVPDSERPEGLNDAVWARYVTTRREKFEHEVNVRHRLRVLNELTRYEHAIEEQHALLRSQIDRILRQQNELQQAHRRSSVDLEVLVRLRQGQVEVSAPGAVVDYSGSLLLPVSVVEGLNDSIGALAKQIVEVLVDVKNFRRNINMLQWENERSELRAEQLVAQTRDFQLLRVTKQLHELIKGGGETSLQQEISNLEDLMKHSKESHRQKMEAKRKSRQRLMRMLKEQEEENAFLRAQLEDQAHAVRQREFVFNVSEQLGSSVSVGPHERFKQASSRLAAKDTITAQERLIADLEEGVETVCVDGILPSMTGKDCCV